MGRVGLGWGIILVKVGKFSLAAKIAGEGKHLPKILLVRSNYFSWCDWLKIDRYKSFFAQNPTVAAVFEFCCREMLHGVVLPFVCSTHLHGWFFFASQQKPRVSDEGIL